MCVCVCVCVAEGAGDWLATAGERKENTAAGKEERRGEERRGEERRGEDIYGTLPVTADLIHFSIDSAQIG